MDRLEKVKLALKQWEEGAITYLELVRYIMAQTTPEDISEFLRAGQPDGAWPFDREAPGDDHRYDYAYDRLTTAVALLLADTSPEGQTLLHLLIDNEVYGDALMNAIETAERYLKEKGEVL